MNKEHFLGVILAIFMIGCEVKVSTNTNELPPPSPCRALLENLKDTNKKQWFVSPLNRGDGSCIIFYNETMQYCYENGSCTESYADSGSYSETDGLIHFKSSIDEKRDTVWLDGRTHSPRNRTNFYRSSGILYWLTDKKIDSSNYLMRACSFEDKDYLLNESGDGHLILMNKFSCRTVQEGLFRNHSLFNGKEYSSNDHLRIGTIFKDGKKVN